MRTPFHARIFTVLPELFPGVLGASVPGRALAQGLWTCDVVDIRAFGQGKHRQVDDTPFGGGPGMVLRADVVAAALDAPRSVEMSRNWPRVYASPRGKLFTQSMAREWAEAGGVELLCGRFEGVDERVLDTRNIQEVSLGDYVLFGGEVAAQAMLEATLRLLPGVLGEMASLHEESFVNGLLEHPHYTRPAVWEGMQVPPVLTSGHHGRIATWRKNEAERLTKTRRPDLWKFYVDQQLAGQEGDDV